jgi:hypothetical protein
MLCICTLDLSLLRTLCSDSCSKFCFLPRLAGFTVHPSWADIPQGNSGHSPPAKLAAAAICQKRFRVAAAPFASLQHALDQTTTAARGLGTIAQLSISGSYSLQLQSHSEIF